MRKLYRSQHDRKIFGVCGGLSEYLGVDATLLRILLVIVAVFSAGSVILVYILAGFVIPKEPFHGGYNAGPANFGWNGGHGANGGYGNGGPSYQQPQYGNQGWPPGSSWPGAGTPQPASRPAAGPTPTAAPASQGIDAMMEDIEKKALRREIEELKAKINKIERDSKGE